MADIRLLARVAGIVWGVAIVVAIAVFLIVRHVESTPAPSLTPVLEPSPAQPTQTVVVTVPPDGGWLTQPWATVVAASIALAAAYFAWKGVQRRVNAAAEEGIKNRKAEDKRSRLAEQIRVLGEAVRDTEIACDAAAQINAHGGSKSPEELADRFTEHFTKSSLARDMLLVMGLQKSAHALDDVLAVSIDCAELKATPQNVRARRFDMLKVFSEESHAQTT